MGEEGHESNVHPPLAHFHPNIWGNQFLLHSPDSDKARWASLTRHVEQLKEKVRTKLHETASNPSEQLQFIDAIQRLGIEYQFEEEISQALQKLYEKHQSWEDNDHFYTAAFYFRILQQEGFGISSEIFTKFLDAEGRFEESLVNDVPGMLALYEAAHLRFDGENILDLALDFTSDRLQSLPCKLSSPLAELVSHALLQPNWRGLPRLEARHYISIYEKDPSHNTTLLKLAKLDFNMLQSLYKEELHEISLWWKELDFARKLPFARDRIVKGYFWIAGVYFEPQYMGRDNSLARKIMSKVMAMTSIIDDIYDAYGTFKELVILTEAIERYDIIGCINQLPDYMKICYVALLDLFEEIEEEMANKGTSYWTDYAKEAMKVLVRAYFVEAKWLHRGYIPPFEGYMQIGLATCGYITLTIIAFLGMGDIVTKEAFNWALSGPDILRAASIICRLRDDIVGHKFEQERAHIASAVECYIKQHRVSEQQACDELRRQVEDAWLLMNQNLLKPTEFLPPKAVLLRVLNLARVMEVAYKHKDEYTHVGETMKSYINSLFIEPIAS
ncbi:valencene synthase-like [Coffea arabica]|uniref:myrcene synthase n=1 Tax=Coffea arabica TaxID=13443 RepID=A0A6P6XBY4_COFAR|nr:valencene synthase-like [Coffea arabica]